MASLILSLLLILGGLAAPFLRRGITPLRSVTAGNDDEPSPQAARFTLTPAIRYASSAVMLVTGLLLMVSTSIVQIPGDQVGIVRKIYGGQSLPQGRLIATNGETGYQADIFPPGAFRVIPFFNVFNEVLHRPVVRIPSGFYGRVVTRDGEDLADGDIMAAAWVERDNARFLNAREFLANHGRRGLQATILTPGTYPVNLALYEVRIGYENNGQDVVSLTDDIYDLSGLRQEKTPLNTGLTRIPAGFVGVVRSTITEAGANCRETTESTAGSAGLVARLVPRGCRGIWNESLAPGDYYLNRDAYDVTLVDTRVQTLDFRGGYTRRFIDLRVDQKGDFTQNERTQTVEFNERNAIDPAVNTKAEGWEVQQELRVVLQVQPRFAPVVVAAVGGLSEVEKRIMVPAIRSHVRNVFGGLVTLPDENGNSVTRQTRVLDVIEHRPALENEIQRLVAEDGRRAGVDVKEIRLGESVIPPELLLARQREQLAGQLRSAFEQEQTAQTQRQAAEQARATADQQRELVSAQIAVQQAKLAEERRAAEGRAERAYLTEQAAGQQEQTNVLGRENVMHLQVVRLALVMMREKPEILGAIRLPSTMVIGGSGGLDGAAAILGQAMAPSAASAAPRR